MLTPQQKYERKKRNAADKVAIRKAQIKGQADRKKYIAKHKKRVSSVKKAVNFLFGGKKAKKEKSSSKSVRKQIEKQTGKKYKDLKF